MEQLYQGIRNANEEFIATKLEQVWETSKFCQCSRCKRDVYTYVLNKIEPHYVDSTQGELFMKLNFRDKGHNIEMIKVINSAMEVVGRNPKHEKPPAPEEAEQAAKPVAVEALPKTAAEEPAAVETLPDAAAEEPAAVETLPEAAAGKPATVGASPETAVEESAAEPAAVEAAPEPAAVERAPEPAVEEATSGDGVALPS